MQPASATPSVSTSVSTSAAVPALDYAHGGPDALGVPAFDFSSNQNATGPCPSAAAAVQAADCGHYPDPHYTALRRA
jgi:histidinol-phosphate aminotransferase